MAFFRREKSEICYLLDLLMMCVSYLQFFVLILTIRVIISFAKLTLYTYMYVTPSHLKFILKSLITKYWICFGTSLLLSISKWNHGVIKVWSFCWNSFCIQTAFESTQAGNFIPTRRRPNIFRTASSIIDENKRNIGDR